MSLSLVVLVTFVLAIAALSVTYLRALKRFRKRQKVYQKTVNERRHERS